MTWQLASEKILATMLEKLGFSAQIEQEETQEALCLQILCEDSKLIIGKNGDRLEDFQYLVNRILQKHYPDAPRVKVDCDHYRKKQEEALIEKAKLLAQRVLKEGKAARTRPLNAYYRRIVHNALEDFDEVETSSPRGNTRYKRIQITLKSSS